MDFTDMDDSAMMPGFRVLEDDDENKDLLE